MSRIHEALKRAEQERAAARSGHAESAAVLHPPAPEPPTGTETSPPAATSAGAIAAEMLLSKPGRASCTLRAARLHLALGTTSAPDLGDYLMGESDEFSIMQRGPMENLFFIACGHRPAQPAELIANGRLKRFLQGIEALFDGIVIDSPPAVPVSDAGQLAHRSDSVRVVVRSNSTPCDTAQKARPVFAGKNRVGVVLNPISPDRSRTLLPRSLRETTAKRTRAPVPRSFNVGYPVRRLVYLAVETMVGSPAAAPRRPFRWPACLCSTRTEGRPKISTPKSWSARWTSVTRNS